MNHFLADGCYCCGWKLSKTIRKIAQTIFIKYGGNAIREGWNVMSIKILRTFVELFFISRFFAINSPSLLAASSSSYFPSLIIACPLACGIFIAPLFYHTKYKLLGVGGLTPWPLKIFGFTLDAEIGWETSVYYTDAGKIKISMVGGL